MADSPCCSEYVKQSLKNMCGKYLVVEPKTYFLTTAMQAEPDLDL